MPGGESLHAPTVAAMLVGAAGVALLVSGGDTLSGNSGGPGLLVLFLLLQLGAIAWSVGSIVQRRQTSATHPFVSAAVQQLAVGVVYLPAAVFQSPHVQWTTRALSATVYLAVFGGIVGYSSYVFAMQRLPVAVASTYTYVNPLVAVLLGWLLYREAVSVREGIAMAVIFAGVWLVKHAQGRREARRQSASAG